MGYNSILLVLNDALDYIEVDPEIGHKIKRKILEHYATKKNLDIAASGSHGTHCNAMSVLANQHADVGQLVFVGGNTGRSLPGYFTYAMEDEQILRELAAKLGFTVSKKKAKKP